MQAQTVANFFLAFDQNLAIVPVLNKIDMLSADPDKVAEEMQQVPFVTVIVTSRCYLYNLSLPAMSRQHGFASCVHSPAWHAVNSKIYHVPRVQCTSGVGSGPRHVPCRRLNYALTHHTCSADL